MPNAKTKTPNLVAWTLFHAPYIQTKPLHPSQQIIEKTDSGTVFSICVIPNFELEKELLGFGEGLKVLSPASLVRKMSKKVRMMVNLYS